MKAQKIKSSPTKNELNGYLAELINANKKHDMQDGDTTVKLFAAECRCRFEEAQKILDAEVDAGRMVKLRGVRSAIYRPKQPK